MRNWKISRDRFYNRIADEQGEYAPYNAGFFEDNALGNINIDDTLDVMCTPLNFMAWELVKILRTGKKPCVLLTTGSFNPIHKGHIESMVKTKEHLEKEGWSVVGGYFAPDHDEYIQHKLGPQAIPFHYRMDMLLRQLVSYPWLTVDPWAGWCQPVAVNFTDIITRLERYLKKHFNLDIPVFYVFGADNYKFLRAFEYEGHAVMTERPGYDPLEVMHLIDDERLYFVNKSSAMSSTEMRKLSKWEPSKKQFVIRVDNTIDDEEAVRRVEALILGTNKNVLKNIEYINVDTQLTELDDIVQDRTVLNLDSMIPSKYDLEICREYDLGGFYKLGYTNRPGSEPLEWQLEKLEKQSYLLFDDDIHTGGTMRFVKMLLHQMGFPEPLGEASFINSKGDDEEIIDLRDFFYKVDNCGLVVRTIEGENIRVPYIYPFVCSFLRSSIEKPLEFSIEMWRLNEWYHERKGNIDIAAECRVYLQQLFDMTTNQKKLNV